MEHSKEYEVICPRCGKLLGYVDGKAELKCPRCKAVTVACTGQSPKIINQSVQNAE